jgi:hypothetical protein
MKPSTAFLGLLLASCRGCPPSPLPTEDATIPDAAVVSTAVVLNNTTTPTTTYISFGANSEVGPADWAFCTPVPSGCSFPLAPGASQALPSAGKALDITIAFDQPPGCQTTLAEVNLSILGWSRDTANISLVNGWSNNVEILVSDAQTLGPTNGPDANADVYGVFPTACDICVARSEPPCGFDASGCTKAGSCGCKQGTQYNPSVPCQESFARGSVVTVVLVSGP